MKKCGREAIGWERLSQFSESFEVVENCLNKDREERKRKKKEEKVMNTDFLK